MQINQNLPVSGHSVQEASQQIQRGKLETDRSEGGRLTLLKQKVTKEETAQPHPR